MLSPDRNDQPKRGWMLAAAAVAGLALVGGLVFATTRSTTTPCRQTPRSSPFPRSQHPTHEVDPDAEPVVVPAPEPTTAAEVVPEPEPVPEPVTVTVTGTFAESGVTAGDDAHAQQPGSRATRRSRNHQVRRTVRRRALRGCRSSGPCPMDPSSEPASSCSPERSRGSGPEPCRSSTCGRPSTGSGAPRPRSRAGPATSKGRTALGVSSSDPANPSGSGSGSNVWTITVPPKGSLVDRDGNGHRRRRGLRRPSRAGDPARR